MQGYRLPNMQQEKAQKSQLLAIVMACVTLLILFIIFRITMHLWARINQSDEASPEAISAQTDEAMEMTEAGSERLPLFLNSRSVDYMNICDLSIRDEPPPGYWSD